VLREPPPSGDLRAQGHQLKSFSTKRIDDVIPKFSNWQKKLFRQNVFALTLNDTGDYFVDPTGNRRWWPVFCRAIDLEGLTVARDLLWAEAVMLFKANEKWWPVTDQEKALCRGEQEQRQVHDVWEDRIRDGVLHLEHVSVSNVLGIVGLPTDRQGRREQLRATTCLKAIGWVHGARTKQARRWVRGPSADPMAPEPVTKEEIAEQFRLTVIEGGASGEEVGLDDEDLTNLA